MVKIETAACRRTNIYQKVEIFQKSVNFPLLGDAYIDICETLIGQVDPRTRRPCQISCESVQRAPLRGENAD